MIRMFVINGLILYFSGPLGYIVARNTQYFDLYLRSRKLNQNIKLKQ